MSTNEIRPKETTSMAALGEQTITESFAVALNPLVFSFKGSVEVIPGHYFRKPSESELAQIRIELDRVSPRGKTFGPAYEFSWVRDKTTPRSYRVVPLPQDKWRYAVVSFQGTNAAFDDLQNCFLLLSPSIEFGFLFLSMGNAYGVGQHAQSFNSYVASVTNNVDALGSTSTITRKELTQINRLYDAYLSAKSEASVVSKNLQSFRNLKSLPRDSDATIILSFAIIESLVTHKSKLIDSLDSIKHQVRTKMLLLNKRFYRPVSSQSFFGAISEERMWSKLYDVRSAIAHGQEINFSGNDFRILVSRKLVCAFLEEVLKSLLTFGLLEPAFLEDLRAV